MLARQCVRWVRLPLRASGFLSGHRNCRQRAESMGDSENSFFGLKVPDGTDRRELYKSQYRGIWTYKMSAGELDESFRTAVTGDGPDGGWTIKNDERVKYVGKLEVSKGEDTTLKVRVAEDAHRALMNIGFGRSRGTGHKGGWGWGQRRG